jgi:hypothetical protein
LLHPSPQWIERSYVNGFYARWEPLVTSVARLFPFSIGDLAVLAGVAALVWRIAVGWRKPTRAAFDVAAIVGLYVFWFEAGWGWNYNRAPVETRLAYDAAAVTPAALRALRAQAVAEIDALASSAHAESRLPLNLQALRMSWLPVVQRAGDRWTPSTISPKPTLAGPLMDLNGTAGFINPLTLTVQSAPDLLWFERPFDIAHEWSHLAGFAREDEANYLAAVTCLRSPDPVVRYSGWIELFESLPPLATYPRRMFVPLVWDDFAAQRARDARHINLAFAHWSWRTYNVYLKSNHIASGVANYNEVTRLMLAIPRDRRGLPKTRVTNPS